jgi:hypothetical protein
MAKTARKPRAVREQEKHAEALMKGEVRAPVIAAVPSPEPAPVEAEPEMTPQETAEAIAAIDGEPVVEPAQEPDWQQRYNTLQGKYNAEIPRLTGTIEGLTQRLDRMEQAPASPEPAAAETTFDDVGERETYGDDFIDLVERRADRIVGERLAKLTPQINKISGQVTENRQETVRERLYGRLTETVPEWRTINNDPAFLTWLAGIDPFTGAPIGTLLRGAFDAGHADRVIAIFSKYLEGSGTAVPTPPQTRRPGRANLADLATPGQTRTAARGPVEPPNPTPVTRAEIATFYSDVARGGYKGHDEDRAKEEQRINAAVSRGLVTA